MTKLQVASNIKEESAKAIWTLSLDAGTNKRKTNVVPLMKNKTRRKIT